MLREQVHYWFLKKLNSIYITSNTKNHCFGSNEYRRIAILRKYLNRIDDWLKGRSKHGSAELKCGLERKYKIIAKCFNIVIEELHHHISADRTTKKSYMKS